MIDFSDLEKRQKNSFGQQKQLIKQVMAGRKVLCAHCQQPLTLQTQPEFVVICCPDKCTELMLTAEK
ncbi:hypothetical protein [Celerinatantimonas sp. YJH-8]|uniref:hypothetical protein n=1 Tax=Celerinatantimonas sp. YJH-8 TaxID=3228714 RepID=UPI0038C7D45A